MSKRSSSSKLFFYDLHGGGAKVQVMADARYFIIFHSSLNLYAHITFDVIVFFFLLVDKSLEFYVLRLLK